MEDFGDEDAFEEGGDVVWLGGDDVVEVAAGGGVCDHYCRMVSVEVVDVGYIFYMVWGL